MTSQSRPPRSSPPLPPLHAPKQKAGLKSGQGVMAYADGSKYHGQYKEGLRCGQGTCYYANGAR
eukprot:scaffold31712_cov73-Isochrysis_galbana.AAC.1